MTPSLIVLVVAGVLVAWLILTFNRLVTLRNRVREADSDIDVQSKRRADLIPNLMETVKGYVKHEAGVLEAVTAARAAVSAGGPAVAKEAAENQLTSALKSLFAVAENYPDLKANTNFLELQRELSDTENKMMAARRFHNSTVNDLNTAVQMFPTNVIAGTFGFREEKFFELENPADAQPVQVKF